MSDSTKCDGLRPNDLVKYLRNSKGWPTLGNKAANRIEELEAKLEKAVELALEECPYRWGTRAYHDWQIDRRTKLAELKGQEPEEPMSNPGDKDYEI